MNKNAWERERESKQRYWQGHLNAWNESGLSQAEYCRQNQLVRRRFVYWKKQITEESTPLSFVSLPIEHLALKRDETVPEIARLSVLLGDRFRVEVKKGFDHQNLKDLIWCLEQI